MPHRAPTPLRARIPLRVRGAARALAVAAALVSAVAGCKAPPLPSSQDLPPAVAAPDLRERLAPDDVLSVVVYGHPEISSGEQGVRVDPEGEVDLPLVGPVRVAGLTVPEAREALRTRAARFLRDPVVSVSVLSFSARLFYVLGEVDRTGAYELDRPTTALQGLAQAGGLRQGADPEHVALLRAEEGRLDVHVFDAATPGADGMVALRPGDVVFVRRSGAGTFREEIMPYLQGIGPPLAAVGSLLVLTEGLND